MTTEPALVTGLEQTLAKHVRENFGQERLRRLREQFADEHLVVLRELVPRPLLDALTAEARHIADTHGTTHDLVFEITDDTPRRMTTVGQPVIKTEGPLIDAFYFNPDLLPLVSGVVGEQVHTCPYAGEHYVISTLDRDGDTHGWHWDDYTYGLVLVLEAPHYTEGGFVQAVPRTS